MMHSPSYPSTPPSKERTLPLRFTTERIKTIRRKQIERLGTVQKKMRSFSVCPHMETEEVDDDEDNTSDTLVPGSTDNLVAEEKENDLYDHPEIPPESKDAPWHQLKKALGLEWCKSKGNELEGTYEYYLTKLNGKPSSDNGIKGQHYFLDEPPMMAYLAESCGWNPDPECQEKIHKYHEALKALQYGRRRRPPNRFTVDTNMQYNADGSVAQTVEPLVTPDEESVRSPPRRKRKSSAQVRNRQSGRRTMSKVQGMFTSPNTGEYAGQQSMKVIYKKGDRFTKLESTDRHVKVWFSQGSLNEDEYFEVIR